MNAASPSSMFVCPKCLQSVTEIAINKPTPLLPPILHLLPPGLCRIKQTIIWLGWLDPNGGYDCIMLGHGISVLYCAVWALIAL